jgi:hypothetical protein
MLERFKFFLALRKSKKTKKRDEFFVYNTKNGLGHAVESYSMFDDRVKIRISRTGYVLGHRYWSREEWLEFYRMRKG